MAIAESMAMSVSTESKLGTMEKDLAHLEAVIDRLDTSVEKLTSISADVTQLLAVHENRLSYQEKMHDALQKQIDKHKDSTVEITDNLHDRVNDVEKEILTKINEQNTKISSLQQWMWTAIGGAAVIIFIIDKILPLLI